MGVQSMGAASTTNCCSNENERHCYFVEYVDPIDAGPIYHDSHIACLSCDLTDITGLNTESASQRMRVYSTKDLHAEHIDQWTPGPVRGAIHDPEVYADMQDGASIRLENGVFFLHAPGAKVSDLGNPSRGPAAAPSAVRLNAV